MKKVNPLEKSAGIRKFIEDLAEKRGIKEEEIEELIKKIFEESIGKKKLKLHFEFNECLEIYQVYNLVEKVENPNEELKIGEEIKLKPGKREKNKFFHRLEVKVLSFELIQEIKRGISDHLWKIQKNREFEDLNLLKGKIVFGRLQNIEKDCWIVNLGKGLGQWKKEEWENDFGKNLKPGTKIYFLIKEISKSDKSENYNLVLTREGNEFIRKILELEIPEIKSGVIYIREILRIPGVISKIIVESKNPKINIAGTCIGKDASRIKGISKITYPERIEIVPWNNNVKELFFNLISPVKTISLIEKEKEWNVTIPSFQMSLMLAKGGKIVEIIEKFLGKKIRFFSLEENKENKITLWNGNLSFEEYQNLDNQKPMYQNKLNFLKTNEKN